MLVLYIFFNLCLCGCKGESYYFKAFAYPPNSKPDENDWEYSGKIIVTSDVKGSISQLSHKEVQIVVFDKNKKQCLADKITLNCGFIDFVIKWDKFQRFIQINEEQIH